MRLPCIAPSPAAATGCCPATGRSTAGERTGPTHLDQTGSAHAAGQAEQAGQAETEVLEVPARLPGHGRSALRRRTASVSADVLPSYGVNLHNLDAGGRCIGISGGYAGDWTCTGNADRLWHSGSLDAGGWFQVVNGNSECLAVSAGSTSQGALVRTWTCNGGADQYGKWSVYSGDHHHLMNYESGLAVGVQSGSTANGASLVLWAAQGHADQLWYRAATARRPALRRAPFPGRLTAPGSSPRRRPRRCRRRCGPGRTV
ncbi:RICIN domain-containing protein [Streptomyces sp. NPDC047000]|uniref:RICIN domain-containing protein n=1 Tax=Streptomyces sp. NPDC047000 TaxID=3155474 RepID=UPI0033D59E9D